MRLRTVGWTTWLQAIRLGDPNEGGGMMELTGLLLALVVLLLVIKME
jgi:hypothetical protein